MPHDCYEGRPRFAPTAFAFELLMGACAPGEREATPDPLGPGGPTLVFASDRGNGTLDLYLHPLDSAGVRLVASDSSAMYGPSRSPDGSRIVYTVEGAETSDVHWTTPDGENRTNLTRRRGYDGNASFSHDGRTIVFVSTREALAESHSGRDLWLMSADGSDVRPLTRNAFYDGAPRFSPDGQKIAFCRQVPTADGALDGEIFVVDRDGGDPVQLTHRAGFDCLPDWSPDGRSLVFHGCGEGGCHLFVVEADGSDLRKITSDAFGGQWPRWSPDGSWIAYTSTRDNQTSIWMIRPDGSEAQRVTTHPGRDEVADWRP